MTSSSNACGDVKHGVRLRKRYFTFKWRTDGESTSGNKNSDNFKTSDEVLDGSGKIGFFRSIKKKLSIKNLCKSKRKITTELPRSVDEGGSSDRGPQVEEKHESVNERIGVATNDDSSREPRRNSAEFCRRGENAKSEDSENNRDRSDEVRNVNSEDGAASAARLEPEADGDGERGNLSNLSQELLKLSKYGWYWGPISGDEADAKLQSEPDGAFLIRDSSDDRYLLTLSFKSAGKLLHARVEHSGGMFSLCNQGDNGRFSSVPALIDHSMNFSKSAVFCYSRPRYPGYPAFPVRLTKPVSRFTQVRSLQYLCRFVIRQNTRLDNIHKLPLPKTIKGYIEEAHY